MSARCAGCGRFSAGPFIDYSEDTLGPALPPQWVGPCCWTPADHARSLSTTTTKEESNG